MLLGACCLGAVALLVMDRDTPPAVAAAATTEAPKGSFRFGFGGSDSLQTELENTRGELELLHVQYERTQKILQLSTRYDVNAGLATTIFDVALAEGIDPELAFRLVRLESDFNHRATSPVGAIGLTQVMPSTAKFFERGITADKLYDPRTNLRIGFRYLRTLIKQFHGDARLALLVYNRGEAAVRGDMSAGVNPSNGYERILMRGYRGTGLID